jgi:hypothetical protein
MASSGYVMRVVGRNTRGISFVLTLHNPAFNKSIIIIISVNFYTYIARYQPTTFVPTHTGCQQNAEHSVWSAVNLPRRAMQFKAVQSSSKQFKAVQSSSKHQIYIYVTATQQYIYFAVQSSSKQFKAPHIYKSKPNYAASA